MSNEDLIAEARQWANGHRNRRSGELMDALLGALDEAREVLAGADHTAAKYWRRMTEAERERDDALQRVLQIDALEAVIERAREWWYSDDAPMVSYEQYAHMKAILSAAPADVLRERDAELIERLADEMSAYYPEDVFLPLTDVDHRAVNDALAGRTERTHVTRDRVSADVMRRAFGLLRKRAGEMREEQSDDHR